MKCFLSVLLVFMTVSLFSQVDLISKKGGKFLYKDQLFTCNEMGPIYEQSVEAFKLYTSGKKNKMVAKFFAYTGLLFVGGGLLGTNYGDLSDRYTGAALLAIGALLELVSIVPALIGSQKLKKARNVFNLELIEEHGYGIGASLSIGISRHGMGVVLLF
ncbi:MAG: hypothetical protein P1U56_01630 [Saprospiraceae bacterium]|nr:hypothetical protein [Saprospiraceae bacterium]